MRGGGSRRRRRGDQRAAGGGVASGRRQQKERGAGTRDEVRCRPSGVCTGGWGAESGLHFSVKRI